MMVLQFSDKFKNKLLSAFTSDLFPFMSLLFVQGLSMRQIRFRFDGQPINETDTPAQVNSKARLKKHLKCAAGVDASVSYQMLL